MYKITICINKHMKNNGFKRQWDSCKEINERERERGPGRWALREYFPVAVALWIKRGPGNTFSGLDYSMLSKSIQTLWNGRLLSVFYIQWEILNGVRIITTDSHEAFYTLFIVRKTSQRIFSITQQYLIPRKSKFELCSAAGRHCRPGIRNSKEQLTGQLVTI